MYVLLIHIWQMQQHTVVAPDSVPLQSQPELHPTYIFQWLGCIPGLIWRGTLSAAGTSCLKLVIHCCYNSSLVFSWVIIVLTVRKRPLKYWSSLFSRISSADKTSYSVLNLFNEIPVSWWEKSVLHDSIRVSMASRTFSRLSCSGRDSSVGINGHQPCSCINFSNGSLK